MKTTASQRFSDVFSGYRTGTLAGNGLSTNIYLTHTLSVLIGLKTLSSTLRKKCPYSELFWSIFSRTRTEYGEIRSISPYSVRMLKITKQNNSEYGHFSRSIIFHPHSVPSMFQHPSIVLAEDGLCRSCILSHFQLVDVSLVGFLSWILQPLTCIFASVKMPMIHFDSQLKEI